MTKFAWFILLFLTPAWGVISTVQHTVNYGSSCGTGTITSCKITIASTGMGHVGVVVLGVTGASKSISSVSDGGSTWSHCAACGPISNTNGASSDIYWTPVLASGKTSVTVTFTSSLSTSVSAWFVELSYTGSDLVLDAGLNGGTVDNTSNTNRSGVNLTGINGTNDVLLQAIQTVGNVTVTNITAPYNIVNTASPGNGYAAFSEALNTTSSSAPTWTFNANAQSVGAAIAFAERVAYSDNDYYEPDGVANFGGTDGPATLPTSGYSTDLSNSANGSPLGQLQADIPNGAGASAIQTVFNNAQCGEVIKFAQGAVVSLVGQSVTIPAAWNCTDGHYIQITVDTSHLPPEQQIATPCWWGVSSLPGYPAFGNSSQGGSPCTTNYGATITTTYGNNGSGPFVWSSGVSHVRLGPGIAIQNNTGGTLAYYQAELGQADHIIFDRMWFRGDSAHENEIGVGFGNADHVAVVRSYFSDFECTTSCGEAHAVNGSVCTTSSCGVYKVVNNFLVAGGENYFFGGAASAATPCDIEIRRNFLFVPLTWNHSDPSWNGGLGGYNIIVKNLGEFKNGCRALIEANVRQNMWSGGGQIGFAILLTPKAYTSSSSDYQVHDITIRWERFNHVCSGLQLSNTFGTPGVIAGGGYNYSIHDILGTDIGASNLYNCTGLAGNTFEIAAQAANAGYGSAINLHDVSLNHITMIGQVTSGWPKSFIIGGSGTAVNPPQMYGLTLTNSIWFDSPPGGIGGYGHTLSSIQRTGNVVTAVLSTSLASNQPGYFAVGGQISETGVSSDTSFNCNTSAPCPNGSNFIVESWDANKTLTWNQSGPNSGPLTNQGTVGYYGCDYQNQSTPGIFTGCFSAYNITENAIYAPTQPTQTWPGVYYNSSTANVGFTNYTGDNTGNYQLTPGSPYHNAGTDGLDIGVSNFTTLNSMTSGVDSLP